MARRQDALNIQILNIKKQQKAVDIAMIFIALERHKNEVLSGDSMDLKRLEHYREYFNKQKGRKYPCSNQIVRCAIVTNDRDKAVDE